MSQQLNWLLAARQHPAVTILIIASLLGGLISSFFPQLQRCSIFRQPGLRGILASDHPYIPAFWLGSPGL